MHHKLCLLLSLFRGVVGDWYEEEAEFDIVMLRVREEVLMSLSTGGGHFRGEPLEVSHPSPASSLWLQLLLGGGLICYCER